MKRVSALSTLRILELSNGVAGEYCGKLLADFGATITIVKDLENSYPPDWRTSRSGRKKK